MKVQRFRLLMTCKIVVEIGEIIMKISTKGRYALRMVIDLAEHADDGFISLKDIAARQGLSKKYLEQIVPLLNKTGMLSTTRGYQGGYKLAKSPSECTVGKILQTTEGSLAPVLRLRHTPSLGRLKPRHYGLSRRNHDPDDPRPEA